jgi:hypothetical protein
MLKEKLPPQVTTEQYRPFVELYEEAVYAEQVGLPSLAGVGYYRALMMLFQCHSNLKLDNHALWGHIVTLSSGSDLARVVGQSQWIKAIPSYCYVWPSGRIGQLKAIIDIAVCWVASQCVMREYRRRHGLEEVGVKRRTSIVFKK